MEENSPAGKLRLTSIGKVLWISISSNAMNVIRGRISLSFVVGLALVLLVMLLPILYKSRRK